jgi:hypothetical protein
MSLADYVAFAEFIVGLGAAIFFAFTPIATMPLSVGRILSMAGLGLMFWGGLVIWKQKPWQYIEGTQENRTLRPIPKPPTIDDIVPPQMAMSTRMHVFQNGPRIDASYWLSNLGIGSTSDISTSVWAYSNGQLLLLKRESVPYLGTGEGYQIRNIDSPFIFGKFVICVMYKFKNHQIEQLDFYYNHSAHQFNVPLPRFRDPVVEVDGRNQLCRSMPATARPYI